MDYKVVVTAEAEEDLNQFIQYVPPHQIQVQ